MENKEMPIYTIGKGKYQLKEYKKLKERETREIADILGIKPGKSEVKIKITSKSFFNILLIQLDETPLDTDELDFEQSLEIITDFIIERERFMTIMGEYLVNSLEKKRKLLTNG